MCAHRQTRRTTAPLADRLEWLRNGVAVPFFLEGDDDDDDDDDTVCSRESQPPSHCCFARLVTTMNYYTSKLRGPIISGPLSLFLSFPLTITRRNSSLQNVHLRLGI